jgi:chaperonin GroES
LSALSLRPVRDQIVVELIEKPKMSAGGIELPQIAALSSQEGIVKRVGPGGGICTLCGVGERKPMRVKEGDRIVFSHFAGSEVKHDGEKLFLISEVDVLGVVTGGE